jgi:hypothetical protein
MNVLSKVLYTTARLATLPWFLVSDQQADRRSGWLFALHNLRFAKSLAFFITRATVSARGFGLLTKPDSLRWSALFLGAL